VVTTASSGRNITVLQRFDDDRGFRIEQKRFRHLNRLPIKREPPPGSDAREVGGGRGQARVESDSPRRPSVAREMIFGLESNACV